MPGKKQISYLGRDFLSSREDIKKYLEEKYPDMSANLEDENSIVSMLLDINSLAVDTLNFYIDKQFGEMFSTTAQEVDSIYKIAHSVGYSPKKKQPSGGYVTLSVQISNNIWDNGTKALRINLPRLDKHRTYFSITDDDGIESKFRLLYDIDWNDKTSSFFGNETIKKVGEITWSYEQINTYEYKVYAKVPAEGSFFHTQTLGPFLGRPFETIHVYDDSFYKIYLVHSDWDNGTAHYTGNAFGDLWFEVDYMINPYGLTRRDMVTGAKTRIQTRRRFISRNTSYGTSITFGYQNRDTLGQLDVLDIPSFPGYGGSSLGDQYWPLAKRPDTGTELICIYLQSQGSKTNLRENRLTNENVSFSYLIYPDDADLHTPYVEGSTAFAGGRDDETIEEIRHNIYSVFFTQNRAVTEEDYIRILERIPETWGVPVFKAGASVRDVTIFKDPSSITVSGNSFTHKEIDLYVVKMGEDNRLTQITDTKEQQSISNYIDQYRMLTDTVYFRRPDIIDINIEYIVSIFGNTQASYVVNEINSELLEFFRPNNWSFGQPIIYDDIVKVINNISGVRNILKLVVYENGDESKKNLLLDRDDISGSTIIYPNQIYQFNSIIGDVR